MCTHTRTLIHSPLLCVHLHVLVHMLCMHACISCVCMYNSLFICEQICIYVCKLQKCVVAHTHTYRHTCISPQSLTELFKNAQWCIYMCVCVRVCMYTYTYTPVHTSDGHMQVCLYVSVRTHVHACVRMQGICMHVCMHIRIQSRIHTYTLSKLLQFNMCVCIYIYT